MPTIGTANVKTGSPETTTHPIAMRTRAILEVLLVMGIVGLLLEISEGHTWIVVGAGAAAALWRIARRF